MLQNVATSMPSLTSQSCSDSLSAVYLPGQVGAIYRPPKHPWTPERPMNEASVKVDCCLLLCLSNGREKVRFETVCV